jgi:ssDNA-binding Zn-finger/Zn-ribbon topoisomerase 1
MATANLPTWSKEYSDGWDNLVNPLVEKLFEIDPTLHIAQIKEKFGGLRAYISPGFDAEESVQEQFETLIREAEEASYTTCEKCGGEGKLISIRGWSRTLCEKDEASLIDGFIRAEENAKAEKARKELEAAEELKTAKASTVCRECGNMGKYRKSIRNEIAVLCDDHFDAWTQAYEERKAFYMKKREEIIAKKKAEESAGPL